MSDPLMTYLPVFYRDVTEFIELTATEDVELQALQTAINRLFNDQFVLTSSEEAVRRRERMLEIVADPTTETLSFRRIRIINRYTTKPPFTERYLQQKLDFIAGVPGLVVVEVDPVDFVLQISVGVENAAVLREIEYTVNLLKPANLVYQPTTFVAERIGLLDQAFVIGLNRLTKLGSWQVGITPFSVRRSPVPL
ncbi:putative phage tail protein [Cohnella silvisoli]|uniref:DUF2313 domain-containing protein n=1 Tax=Cohnella silvisoli TaxID=2873699 RepID=A0ABV1L305_9BACL|nr:putative phage tail protein [Cohnella silvisoli]MCD9026058.1 YmfQ family protein [Cohnella silvisoli]